MATLTAEISATDRTIRITDPGTPRVGAYYVIDDEVVVFAGLCGAVYEVDEWVPEATCWYVARGTEGTLAAAHDADAAVTEFDVTAGGGGGLSNPLTENLDAGGFQILSVPVITGGPSEASNTFLLGDGGDMTFYAASGGVGLAGRNVALYAGSGNDGAAAGATITLGGADGAGTPGAITFSHAGPVIPLTTPDVQQVIDALVALGLVSQSD